jgi:hypothetical protein
MPETNPDDVDAVADGLYRLDPADFVAARAELVKRLRADKQRDLAAGVAKLRRPIPAAWAVNQLARDRRADVEALVRRGRELRDAQAAALAGADPAELRRAARARREAVGALTGAAASLLSARGAGVDAHLPGVIATLEAASLDPDAGAAVLRARLSEAMEPPSGFGIPGGEPVPTRVVPDRTPQPEPEPEPRRAGILEAERAVEEARRAAGEAAAAAREAGSRAAARRRALEEAEVEVVALRRRLEEAEAALARAVSDAESTDRLAAQADAAAAEAVDALEDAARRLAEARG